ncbi:ABC transporter permease [Gluconacetobacter entanii]|uniref:ABC transporter n=1 Tax=Gluconacetobacter entanii TaxID=108528 RepID=A0A318PTT4_9PROT|nr:ABC transporter permease [Gluconacetobacter entanii]MBE7620707.1 ABC transporter [Komagataeibacter sp. FXV2]MCE2579322.1 ABC transporter permease [Komagataeibacter sp. FNDCR1]MBY4640199.1 ABC transporter permease [Gluconacetobacter entanii]MCW4580797.1 ABC transporter permease [Gluconacetobacter entanii]MCW4584126.1 ABC transporter permease [Gluconacetobacter entanii]
MTQVAKKYNELAILKSGFETQWHVLGALIIRELHTRFGRDNIGFLWIMLEPSMLTLGVSALHAAQGPFMHIGMPTGSFLVSGYTFFCLFRSVVNRSGGAIESNRSLLYHRIVTIFDILLSRALLEAAATVLAVIFLSLLMQSFSFGFLPERPLLMIWGLVLLTWLSFGLSMLLAAYSEKSSTVERLSHPLMYLSMPLSGAFTIQQTMPDPFRWYLSWFPTTEIFEIIREGQFDFYESDYTYPAYVIGWCLALTYLGLISIRNVRKDIHLG